MEQRSQKIQENCILNTYIQPLKEVAWLYCCINMNLNENENEEDRFKKQFTESQWNLVTDMVEEEGDTRINYKVYNSGEWAPNDSVIQHHED